MMANPTTIGMFFIVTAYILSQRACSGNLPGLMYRKNGSQPESQHHLGKEGANGERKERVPGGLFATALVGT